MSGLSYLFILVDESKMPFLRKWYPMPRGIVRLLDKKVQNIA
jgi:hypothetical protein